MHVVHAITFFGRQFNILIGMTFLSSIAMSAYTDLVSLLNDDALSGVEGKPTLKERGAKADWYAAQRIGTEMRFTV
jgi:hypothetical protein